MSDLIRRQDAIDALIKWYGCEPSDIGAFEDIIEKMPSAQPEPQEGKWVYGEDFTADCVDGYRCSRCGFFVPWDYNYKLIDYINDYVYCPNCGAKMWNILTRKPQKEKQKLTKREEEIRRYIFDEYTAALRIVAMNETPETIARKDEARKILGKIIDILEYE